jgi:hypothetical protein
VGATGTEEEEEEEGLESRATEFLFSKLVVNCKIGKNKHFCGLILFNLNAEDFMRNGQ